MFLNTLIFRYISKSFIFWFFIISCVLSLIVSCFELVEFFRKTAGLPHVTFAQTFEFAILQTTEHLQVLLPFFSFFASLIVFWKLNQHNELLVIRSLGISIWKMIGSWTVLILAIGAIYLAIINPIFSVLNLRLNSLEKEIFGKSSTAFSVLPSGLWLYEIQKNKHVIFYAKSFDLTSGLFKDVKFYDRDIKNYTCTQFLEAELAHLHPQKWEIHNARIWDQSGKDMKIQNIKRPTLFSIKKLKDVQRPPQTMSFWSLGQFIREMESIGLILTKHKLFWYRELAKVCMILSMSIFSMGLSWRISRYHSTYFLMGGGIFASLMLHFLSNIVAAFGLSGRMPLLLSSFMVPFVTFFLAFAVCLHQEDT